MLTNKIYSSEVLDTQYEQLLKERLDFLKENYSKEELQLISFDDLSLMGNFLSTVKPISHTRKHKKTLLKYADIYVELNKDKLKNKKLVHQNTNTYLLRVSKYLEKFGFRNKGLWSPFIFVLIIIEVLIILLFRTTSYVVPCVSIILFYYANKSEKRALKKGKLLDLYWGSLNTRSAKSPDLGE